MLLASSILLLMLTTHISECDGARILGLFPHNGESHHRVHSALVEELAARGHELVVLSPFPRESSNPNLTNIVTRKMTAEDLLSGSESPNPLDIRHLNYFQELFVLWEIGNLICDKMLQDPAVQNIIHSDGQVFDIIIMESFFTDCLLGFAHKFNVSVIQLCTYGGLEFMGDLIGNPNSYAYVPDTFMELSDHMSLKERILNTLGGIFQKVGRKLVFLPKQDALMRKHFNYPEDSPSVSELEKSTVLLLINHHFSISYPKPLVPNFVQVGGMHIKPHSNLKADFKKFIEDASDGVIYFSMGTVLKSSQMSKRKVMAFVEAFSKIKQRVIWKWEEDILPGQPSNVKVDKWLPQTDILAHSNVRLFITHGGLLSTQETIFHGVPVVVIPIFGDQSSNMIRAVSSGYGYYLDYDNITAETINSAISEVLENSSYRENVQRLSRIYRDQPLTPLEQAVFWTEHVIRHKGAPHMRSAALDLTWYQYFLLDVIVVLISIVITVLLIMFIILKSLCNMMCGDKGINTSRKKVN